MTLNTQQPLSLQQLELLQELYQKPRDYKYIQEKYNDCADNIQYTGCVEKKTLFINEADNLVWIWINENGRKVVEESRKDLLLSYLGLSKDEAVEEMQQYISDLHTYNELKDLAQTLLGKLAESKSCTLKDIYMEFDVEDEV